MDLTSYLLGKRSGGSKGLKVVVVQELPTTGEENILYLVPKTTTGTNNVFEEYLYVDNSWELIGTTDIDLSGYQIIANLVTSLSSQSTDTQYPSAKLLYDLFSETSSFYITTQGYSSNYPFVFEGKKKGNYLFISPFSDGRFYYKVTADGATKSEAQLPFVLNLPSDFNYVDNHYYFGNSISLKSDGTMYTGTPSLAWNVFSMGSGNLKMTIITSGNQTFAGVKTFSSIPKQSNTTAPTDNAQFTNKKYVDDRIQQVYISCGLSAYSTSSTYAVGDYVYYGNTIYKCNTAIQVAEAWDSTHWTVSNLKEYLTSELVGTALGGSY